MKAVQYQPAERGVISARLRFATLAKCEFRCHYCGCRPQEVGQLVVDHVLPVAAGGKTEPSNLVAACVPCNMGKSSGVIDAPSVPPCIDLNILRVGRPPIGKFTAVRLSAEMLARIDALAGPGKRAEFIRRAVEAELQRREG